MFSRAVVTLYFLLSLSILAAAKPWNTTPPPVTTTATATVTVTVSAPAPTGGDTCSTGPIQCCNSVGSASDPAFSGILGLLGIVLEGVEALVGLGCSPISVVGVGSGNACSATTVCCQNNSVGGLISIGCIPIIL
ncbi:fungal hydrophobin [Dichomitus squalens]|uniref:Hydrophobin n=1 Tax=Dichomitus squalens TaxID=114155 RepID=A0A4Q9PXK9_9APHY|nr:fungal hydrophobin [Dichomitus squalens]